MYQTLVATYHLAPEHPGVSWSPGTPKVDALVYKCRDSNSTIEPFWLDIYLSYGDKQEKDPLMDCCCPMPTYDDIESFIEDMMVSQAERR